MSKYLDKYMHAAAGIIILLVLFAIYDGLTPLMLVVVGLAAAGKEWYDMKHPDKHDADGWDAFWTLFPAVIVYCIVGAAWAYFKF